MHFPFLHSKNETSQQANDGPPPVVVHEHFENTMEGSEFIDDAIRMKDDINDTKVENNKPLEADLSDLEKKGYTDDLQFEVDTFALYAGDLDMRLNPQGFHVDEIDRIGDDTNPKDGAVVYAISTPSGVKGVIIERPDETTDENETNQQA